MRIVTWIPGARGTIRPIGTADHPGLTRLSGRGPGFVSFEASQTGDPNPTVSIRGRSYFAVYVECRTDRGRRQFKFVPTGEDPRLILGYRYQAGLGSRIRDGRINTKILAIGAIAQRLEPGIVIEEVTSLFVRVAGSIDIELLPEREPTDPTPPPPAPPSPGSPEEVEFTRAEAVRFLTQATFGASSSAIDELMSFGSYEAWIDRQLALPISRTEPYTRINSNGSASIPRHYIWWENVLNGEDQLRQRLAFALSQIFVVSDIDYLLSNAQYGMTNYYDMLAEESFGNFRSLLERVTLHPVMGIYLSMVRNEKADEARNVRPDENYAREVLQLFTLGLYELNPDGEIRTENGEPVPSYDQETVEELARVFTGWNYADSTAWDTNRLTAFDKTLPMTADQAYHDTEAKTLFGTATLAAGRTAEQDLADALDIIFRHPNVGPFISRALIKHLVTSNPTPAYVGRVAAVFDDDGTGVRGNLGPVARAILTDPEARTGHVSQPDRFGKVKEPLVRLTQVWRAFDAEVGNDGIYRTRSKSLARIEEIIGEAAMRSPSVFNFYHPENPLHPGSDLVSPEKQILSEVAVASTNNMFFSQIYDHNDRVDAPENQTLVSLDRELAMASDIERLLDHLQELLIGGALPADYRAALAGQLAIHPTTDEGLRYRVLDAIFCIVASPFHYVQK